MDGSAPSALTGCSRSDAAAVSAKKVDFRIGGALGSARQRRWGRHHGLGTRVTWTRGEDTVPQRQTRLIRNTPPNTIAMSRRWWIFRSCDWLGESSQKGAGVEGPSRKRMRAIGLRRALLRSLVMSALATCGVLGWAAGPAAASTTHDLRGTWDCCADFVAAQQTFDITTMDLSSGKFSGDACTGSPCSPFSPITGTATGNSVTLITGPYLNYPDYSATFTGTISADNNSMSGTWQDTGGRSSSWTATRVGGGGGPQIAGVDPTGGPVDGGTPITIYGANFTSDARVFIGSQEARNVTVQSSSKITATDYGVGLDASGRRTVEVDTGSGRASIPFFYYVPQIGILLYRDVTQNPAAPNSKYFSACTATVVRSRNRDTLLTAGHCLTSNGVYHDEIVFAPGYYGPFCPIDTNDPLARPEDILACGNAPYGLWKYRAGTSLVDPSWLFRETKGLDVGFLDLDVGGANIEHVADAVGSLPVEFCAPQGSSRGCDASRGKDLQWTAYGEPDATAGLVHCGGFGATIDTEALAPYEGVDNLLINPCTTIADGASGGPWIRQSVTNRIGAVNEGICCNGQTAGTYLGEEASALFNATQFSGARRGLWESIVNVISSLKRGEIKGLLTQSGFSMSFQLRELDYSPRS